MWSGRETRSIALTILFCHVPGEPNVPGECQAKGYCDIPVPDYPTEAANKVVAEVRKNRLLF